MRIRQSGKICDGLWFLGRKESCVYLLEGSKESMIISGGMGYLVPDLLKQFDEFNIDKTRIKKLLILHCHFDHVGVIPFMKRRHPDMTIYGSARAWEILRMPKAISTINEYSRDVAGQMGMEEACSTYDMEWRDDITGEVVSEGDIIDLGDLWGRIYETPGHSSCAVSFYVPQFKALFPSDSGGIPFGNTIITSGNSNFTKYQESLEKLKDLEVEYYCADHYGYVSGDEASTFMEESIHIAKGYRALMERTYLRTGGIDSAAKEIVNGFYQQNADYFLTREIMEGVQRQMVRHIAEALE
ncbi:MAG: MBL fold metallo-hydrolase [Deltaproteobacteria bacterium]|nr:MBL fold metallo-hydrolase [Deltaproteobacteria bacterium]